ncbi:MAG: hypothetical protein MHPSP_003910, partial [Paramarteilia canceri]
MEKIGTFTKEEILTTEDFINAGNEFDKYLKVLDNSETVEIVLEKNESDGSDQDEGYMSEKIKIMTFKEAEGRLEKILNLFKNLPEAESDDMKAILKLKLKSHNLIKRDQ